MSTCKHFDGGTCRRYPPVATGHGNPNHPAAYAQPVVERYGRCGEWSALPEPAVEPAPPSLVVEPAPATGKAAKRKGVAL